jgi:hypothetical protein
MRHRENRRIRQAFDGHLINRKIRNDHFKFAENFNDMRHRENRRIRNRNWDPANAKGFFTKTIPSIFNSATNGLLGGGGRGGGGGSSGSQRMEGGPEGMGAYGGGAGSGGMSESGSIVNPELATASTHTNTSDGSQSLPLIPIAIGVVVVGYFLFSKKN